MTRYFDFVVLRFSPHRDRDESINLGVVVLSDEMTDVRLDHAIHKVKSLAPGLDLDSVRDISKSIPAALCSESTVAGKLRALRNLNPFSVSAPGVFAAQDASDYEREIAILLRDLVRPRSVLLPDKVAKPRLATKFRNVIRSNGLLSADPEDIYSHKVVEDFPIDVETDLFADFAFRNGNYHFFQILDFTPGKKASLKFRECCEKALAFDQARLRFGSEVRGYVLFTVEGNLRDLSAPLSLLRRYSSSLVDVRSERDLGFLSDVFGRELLSTADGSRLSESRPTTSLPH